MRWKLPSLVTSSSSLWVSLTTTLTLSGTTVEGLSSSSSSTAAAASVLRSNIMKMVSQHQAGQYADPAVRTQLQDLLESYANHAEADPSDVVFAIGSAVYGIDITPTATTSEPKKEPDEEEKKGCIVDFDYMKQFIKDVFISYGVTRERAEICAEVLIEADRQGIDSHGLGRLKTIYCDRMDKGILFPDQPITVVKETDTTALVDGNLGLGLYIGPHCMQMAIHKAKLHGVGLVVVRRSTHYGIAGYYATMASEAGCIGFVTCNARPSIAPTFGVEPLLGTNPLTFGIPTADAFDFCIDCASSITQRGKIEKYARDGVPTPKGSVIDLAGVERTDSQQILKDMVQGTCCLTPLGGVGDRLGGYKGYGWAAAVEILSTAFQDGPVDVCGIDRETGKPKPMPLGHLFLAIDIEAICPLDEFKQNASKLLQILRDSKKDPNGPGRIWTAGEPEHDARLARMAQGGMVVSQPLQEQMKQLRDAHADLQQKYSQFPFE